MYIRGMRAKKEPIHNYEAWCMQQADGKENPFYRMSGKKFSALLSVLLLDIGFCLYLIFR